MTKGKEQIELEIDKCIKILLDSLELNRIPPSVGASAMMTIIQRLTENEGKTFEDFIEIVRPQWEKLENPTSFE